MPILGFMGDLSDYRVKNRKKNLTQQQKTALIRFK